MGDWRTPKWIYFGPLPTPQRHHTGRRNEQREITGCARPGDGLCPLEDFLELALKSSQVK